MAWILFFLWQESELLPNHYFWIDGHDDHCVSIIQCKSAIHLSPNIVDVLDVEYYQHQDLILNNFDFQIDVDCYQNPDFVLNNFDFHIDVDYYQNPDFILNNFDFQLQSR